MKPYQNLNIESLDGEVWIDIPNYDGIYSVSNYGRVKSERRPNPNGRQWLSERILRQTIGWSNPNNIKERSKSLRVTLCVNRKKKGFSVSTLVGMVFIGGLKDGQVYSKKNKIWDDCRADNLEILSFSDCFKLAYEKGNNLRKKKVLIPYKPKYKYLRDDGKYFTRKQLIDEYGKHAGENVNHASHNGRTAYGHHWKAELI